jgi:inorganic pyrophosphatase/exopolyphosphatase
MTENRKNEVVHFLNPNPGKALRDMDKIINTLRSVYERETEALKALDAKTFQGMQHEKLEVARIYQLGIEDILSRKGEMQNANPALKVKLEDAQKDFADLARQNMEALKRMQRAMERMGGTLRNAAKKAVQKQRAIGYSETVKIQRSLKALTTGSV